MAQRHFGSENGYFLINQKSSHVSTMRVVIAAGDPRRGERSAKQLIQARGRQERKRGNIVSKEGENGRELAFSIIVAAVAFEVVEVMCKNLRQNRFSGTYNSAFAVSSDTGTHPHTQTPTHTNIGD